MLVRIDPGSVEALHMQIAAQIRGAIADGRLQGGDRLPSARDLAQSLGVNMHTVLRGYSVLRDEGMVEMRRGRGVVVLATAANGRARLVDIARQLVAESARLGVSRAELRRLIEEVA